MPLNQGLPRQALSFTYYNEWLVALATGLELEQRENFIRGFSCGFGYGAKSGIEAKPTPMLRASLLRFAGREAEGLGGDSVFGTIRVCFNAPGFQCRRGYHRLMMRLVMRKMNARTRTDLQASVGDSVSRVFAIYTDSSRAIARF